MSFKIIQRKYIKAVDILFYYERLFIRSKLILSISYVKTWIILLCIIVNCGYWQSDSICI